MGEALRVSESWRTPKSKGHHYPAHDIPQPFKFGKSCAKKVLILKPCIRLARQDVAASREAKRVSQRITIMTAITADAFARTPPFTRAHEALSSIMAQHGRARMAAWARAAEDDATRIVAVMLETRGSRSTYCATLTRRSARAMTESSPRCAAVWIECSPRWGELRFAHSPPRPR